MLQKNQGKKVDHKLYRTVVGKLMYYTQKIMVEGANATRELSRHLQNPSQEHWDAIKYMAGYLKKGRGNIKITYWKLRSTKFIAMVNASYATNKDNQKSVTGAVYTLGGTFIG